MFGLQVIELAGVFTGQNELLGVKAGAHGVFASRETQAHPRSFARNGLFPSTT